MDIKPISIANCQNIKFSAKLVAQKKNVDRYATVQDLYEMEDRINAHNEELIKKQNEKLGQVFQSMINHIEHVGAHCADVEYNEAMDNATLLKLNA